MGDSNNINELRNLLENFMTAMNKRHEEIKNNFATLNIRTTNIKQGGPKDTTDIDVEKARMECETIAREVEKATK